MKPTPVIETAPTQTVGEVLRALARNPLGIIRRWNWKSGLFSSVLRGSSYLITYLVSKQDASVAFSAFLVQAAFRFLFSGINGSLIQTFRRAEPVWLATLIVLMFIPAVNLMLEFTVQKNFELYVLPLLGFELRQNTNPRVRAIYVSVAFSILSALFNLFAMRRGILLVGAGAESKSLWHDIKSFPRIIVEFLLSIPFQLWRQWQRGRYAVVAGAVMMFTASATLAARGLTGKWLFGGIAGGTAVFVMVVAIFVAGYFMDKKSS